MESTSVLGLFDLLTVTISVIKIYAAYSIPEYHDYGILRTALLNTVLVQAKGTIIRIRTHVIGSPEQAHEAAIVRSSYDRRLNMIAVAAAIVAQIAITALSLLHLEEEFWTTEACFVASLISSLFSVYFACLLNIKLGSLQRDIDVLDWLVDRTGSRQCLDARLMCNGPKTIKSGGQDVPSFSAVMMLVAPAQLLNWSLTLFIVGIGSYYGQIFSNGIGSLSGQNANLGILLTYILTTVAAAAVYRLPLLGKAVEQRNITKIDECIRMHDTENRWQELFERLGLGTESTWHELSEAERKTILLQNLPSLQTQAQHSMPQPI